MLSYEQQPVQSWPHIHLTAVHVWYRPPDPVLPKSHPNRTGQSALINFPLQIA